MRRRQFEDDMDGELRFHIDAYVEDLVRAGVDPAEARRRARVEFGSLEAHKDECRQAWGLQHLDDLRADLRLTFRTMRRNPGFAAIAILSLALGIGANTAIFGVFDAVMLRLLPVRDPASLVFVRLAGAGTKSGDGPPYPLYEMIRDRARSFQEIAAVSPSSMEFTADRGRELVRGLWVSPNFHEMLGIRPLIGRAITPGDDTAVVISRAFWQQRFGGDPGVLGRTLFMFGRTVTVAGVIPTEAMAIEPGYPVDIAAAMPLSDPAKMRDRTALWLEVVARLKPGVSPQQAKAEAETFFQAYAAAGLTVNPEVRRRLFDHMEILPAERGMGGLRSMFSTPLTALMILAGLVLLAACVNLANLMLARAAARQREFAVRLAIGAGTGRLIRQTLTETLVLVGSAAALGMVLARQGQMALVSFFAGRVSPIEIELSLNGRMLAFTLAVSVISAVAMAILPAMRAARVDPALGLQGGSRGVAGSRSSLRLGRALVVVQVSLSIVLLAGAALFIRTLDRLQAVDLGITRQGILTMEVTPERQFFGTPEWLALQSEILDRLRRVRGVESASWATMTPFSGRGRGALIDVPGFAAQSSRDHEVHLAAVAPEYFATIGQRILLGRDFTLGDQANAPKVAVLNQTAARFYFGEQSPLGRKVQFTNYASRDLIYEVIGVVNDSRYDTPRESLSRFIYLPVPQSVDRLNRLALAVRCAGDPLSLAPAVRRQVQEGGPTLLITRVSTMEKQVEQTLFREQLVASLSSAFGIVALLLASIGLYGILAYAVTRRTNEIGIRMAMGATRAGIVWLILREAIAMTALGILIAIPAILSLGRVVKALLYNVEPFDPVAFGAAASVLLVFAAIAAILPGRRASRLDPMPALRRE